MIILGPAVLTYPDNQVLLQSVEMLIHNLGARVTTLLESCNLAGALRLGLYADGPAPAVQDLDVLYLIGEALPALPSDHTVILYQNLFPPAGDALVDLLLPTTAFAEENGTYIDYAGRVQAVHPAVPPPGEALPSWLILSRIARQMGAQGFAFTCVEDIWQAAQSEFPGFPDVPLHNDLGLWSDPRNTAAHTGSTLQTETNRMCSYSYMGFPLSQWVEGLRSLEPEKTIGSDNEPNS